MSEGNEQPTVTIRANRNGPFRVEGPIRLVDAEGTEYEVPAGRAVSLCRCGGSTRKPFCDGAHSRIGFEAAERAVRESEAEAEGGS